MTDDQVADVLGCSTGTARTLVNRALADLQQAAANRESPARVAAELQIVFDERAEAAAAPDARGGHVLRRARLQRGVVAALLLGLVAASAIGSALAIRASTQASKLAIDDPSPSPSSEIRSLPALSLDDVDLAPQVSPNAGGHERVAASGLIEDAKWRLLLMNGATDEVCVGLQIGTDPPTTHCQARLDIFQAFVDADEVHDATFITGYVVDDVRRMTLAVGLGETTPVELLEAPPAVSTNLDGHFFVVILPTYLEVFDSEEEAATATGDVIRTVLEAETSNDIVLQRQPIYLGLVQNGG